jgi:hypothetical protein
MHNTHPYLLELKKFYPHSSSNECMVGSAAAERIPLDANILLLTPTPLLLYPSTRAELYRVFMKLRGRRNNIKVNRNDIAAKLKALKLDDAEEFDSFHFARYNLSNTATDITSTLYLHAWQANMRREREKKHFLRSREL